MNTKNLWLRFGLVALLIALCLLPLVVGKGMRWGIDLRGGHSLIFEIRTNEVQSQRLKAQARQLEAAKVTAASQEEIDKLSAELDRVEADLKRIGEETDGNLSQ